MERFVSGCLSFRERLDILLDTGSIAAVPYDDAGDIIHGVAHGRRLLLVDLLHRRQTESSVQRLARVVKALHYACSHRIPLVYFFGNPSLDNPHSPIPSDPVSILLNSHCGMGAYYAALARASGVIPQIAAMLGPVSGSGAFPVGLMDIVIATPNTHLSLAQTDITQAIAGRRAALTAAIDADCHYCAAYDFQATDDVHAIGVIRDFLSYLPPACRYGRSLPAPWQPPDIDPDFSVPQAPSVGFNIRRLLDCIVDKNRLLEIGSMYAPELVTAFGQVEGSLCAFVANNSSSRGGLWFPESARKAARFVSLASSYGLPLIFLVDSGGFMVGPDVERAGIIQFGASLFTQLAASCVPKLCVIVRRGYSAGLYGMAGPGFGAEIVALPTASVSIYGPGILDLLASQRLTETEKTSLAAMRRSLNDPSVLRQSNCIEATTTLPELRTRIAKFLCAFSVQVHQPLAHPLFPR